MVLKDSSISRKDVIVVMGINWIDTYNDTETGDIKTQLGSDVPKDKKRVAAQRINPKESGLREPLYYIGNLRLHLLNSENKKETINRFNKDLRGYEAIAIHQFSPGSYDWNHLSFDEYKMSITYREDIRWKKEMKNIFKPFQKWNFEAGKVYYLGDLTLRYQTKRKGFGWLPREELVQRIVLNKIELKDNFEATMEKLKQDKPWLPVGEMVNLSQEKSWDYSDVVLHKKKAEQSNEVKPSEEKEDKEKDKEEYFY